MGKGNEEYGFKMQKNTTAFTETVVCVCSSIIENDCAMEVYEYWTTDGVFIGEIIGQRQ